MSARSPLVRLSTGKIAELPSGDSILGAPAGPAASVTVGTTTTGPAGSSASVTNAGTSFAAVLDFTIPQGATGANGTNGTNGANGTGSGANFICNGRLTLTSGTPVTTADVPGATTIYFTPYMGNQISTYDASVWTGHTLTEISLALGTLTSGKNYDVFVYSNSGTLTLELSAAWTNDTTRADALAVQDGVQVKSADHSRRYLGTFRTTAATTTEDSIAKRFLWNCYNRVDRAMKRLETTASWTYSTNAWRQANASAANQLDYVCGLAEDAVRAQVAVFGAGAGGISFYISLGVDATTPSADATLCHMNVVSGEGETATAFISTIPGVGRHYITWLELADPSTTITFKSANTTVSTGPVQSGMVGVLRG